MDNQLDEIECCLAGWINRDVNGQYLTVELSPNFVTKQRSVEQPDPISELLNEENHGSDRTPPWLDDK